MSIKFTDLIDVPCILQKLSEKLPASVQTASNMLVRFAVPIMRMMRLQNGTNETSPPW